MSSAAAVAGDSSETSISALHPDLIHSHILSRLDGATLASAAASSAQFLSLCSDDSLWQHICSSNWPSTADPLLRRTVSDHRSFFSDAFPARRRSKFRKTPPQSPELISAVDIKFDGQIVLSKVLLTETKSNWFLSTPFRLDLLDPKETVHTALDLNSSPNSDDTGAWITNAAEKLSLSWILIAGERALNVASLNPVEVRRHWLDNDFQLRFATIMADSDGELLQCAVIVTLGGKPRAAVKLKEVSLQLEDMEGKIVTGSHGLEVVRAAMEGEKWKRDGEFEKEEYERFTWRKERYRERKQKRERGVDMVCIAAGIAIFVAVVYFWIICMWR